MSEIKKIIEGEAAKPQEAAQNQNGAEISSIKTALEKSDTEKKQLADRLEETEFGIAFDKIVTKYPTASEIRDKVRELTKKGYSVEDAVVAELGKTGKLKTADEIEAEKHKNDGLGGSTRTASVAGSKQEKSLDELRKEFQDAEARGEIRLS